MRSTALGQVRRAAAAAPERGFGFVAALAGRGLMSFHPFRALSPRVSAGLIALLMGALCAGASASAVSNFLVTNNDVPEPNPPQNYKGSTATFYTLGLEGNLSDKTVVLTGGDGIAGGFFAASRVAIVPLANDVCVFVSNAASNNIAGISGTTRTLTGDYSASADDEGGANGIGLAANASYLYASFSTSSTIATFEIGAGCTLSFVSDLSTVGLSAGRVNGMALNGAMLVATYGDGSIASFNISSGAPTSNGDAQYSTGAAEDHLPNGVVITSDGRFAIFGDASTVSTIEVSAISSGKLTSTVAYDLGTAWNSGNVGLSPDNSLIYVTNNSGGEVSAAFFDTASGSVSGGCTTAPLKGFYETWAYAGGAVLQPSTAHGGFFYVPEFGGNGFSSLGVVRLYVQGGNCTLTELSSSPIVDNTDAASLLSIAAYIGG